MLSPSWFHRRRRGRRLSAFADGELRGDEADRVAEDLVFDEATRRDLSRVRRTDALVAGALDGAAPRPDPERAADAILARLGAPRPLPAVAPTRPWRPTVVASVVMSTGLLVTAGLAYGWKRSRS